MLITIIVFLGRNINRINNEIEVYNYQPFTNINYSVKKSYFDISNLLNNKISNYELCKSNKIKCNEEGKIKIKKLLNYYVLYNEK